MMTAPLEQLAATLHRRNWLILGILLAISLPFGTAGSRRDRCWRPGGDSRLRLAATISQPPSDRNRASRPNALSIRLRGPVAGYRCVLAILIAIVKIHPAGLVLRSLGGGYQSALARFPAALSSRGGIRHIMIHPFLFLQWLEKQLNLHSASMFCIPGSSCCCSSAWPC